MRPHLKHFSTMVEDTANADQAPPTDVEQPQPATVESAVIEPAAGPKVFTVESKWRCRVVNMPDEMDFH